LAGAANPDDGTRVEKRMERLRGDAVSNVEEKPMDAVREQATNEEACVCRHGMLQCCIEILSRKSKTLVGASSTLESSKIYCCLEIKC